MRAVRHSALSTLFEPLRRSLPAPVARALRAGATALLAPVQFAYRTGHFRSSLQSRAQSASGEPLPWYTYPCIDFLAARRDRVRSVLEFGAGQSTLWWAARGARVVAFEGQREAFDHLRSRVPNCVDLCFTGLHGPEACLREVRARLAQSDVRKFDVVVIGGLYRGELTAVALEARAAAGIIVCDDSEGHGIHDRLRDSGLNRVDFFGFAPGVVQPHCSSIYFAQSGLFDARLPIERGRD